MPFHIEITMTAYNGKIVYSLITAVLGAADHAKLAEEYPDHDFDTSTEGADLAASEGMLQVTGDMTMLAIDRDDTSGILVCCERKEWLIKKIKAGIVQDFIEGIEDEIDVLAKYFDLIVDVEDYYDYAHEIVASVDEDISIIDVDIAEMNGGNFQCLLQNLLSSTLVLFRDA